MTRVRSAKRAAAASESHVGRAARAALNRGANAVDAVVAGIMSAAAEHASVLLGPVQALIGGAGAGLFAVDGRIRQPGRGTPRPRGFRAGEPIPDAARVGVPALPAALAAMLASHGSVSLLRASADAIERARSRSQPRARVIESVARRGAAAMTIDEIAGELVAAAGRSVGGALTARDVAAVRPSMTRIAPDEAVVAVPWDLPLTGCGEASQVVAAADARGLVAIACYESPVEGLDIAPLGLVAPLAAAPVMRGEKRVPPGEPLPAPAPIRLRWRDGRVDLALGIAQSTGSREALQDAIAQIREDTLSFAPDALRSGLAVVIARSRDAAAVLASA